MCEAAKAGASVVHIHVLDPATGKGSRDPLLFKEVVDRVRSSGVDIVLNLTCGLGAFLFLDPDDESRALVESEVLPVAERVRHLEGCLPEIACPDRSLCLSRSLERQPNKVIRSRRRTADRHPKRASSERG